MSPIIDSHFHLDTSMVSLTGMIASMDSAGIERVALIPNMCPPLSLPKAATVALSGFRRLLTNSWQPLREAGQYLYRNTVKNDGTVQLLSKRYEIKVQPRNDEVLEAVTAHPDRFYGWVFVNPAGPVEPLPEIERCLKTPGIIGVKAHPFWHNYPVRLLSDVAALCRELNLPMLIHLGIGANGDYRALPEALPGLKVVYAHAGIPFQNELAEYARTRERIYLDLASAEYVDLRIARHAIRTAGVHKVLFGTDGPYFYSANDRFDYKFFVSRLDELNLSDPDRDRVAGENFRELLGS
jgi:uncharacterized protein